MKSTSTLSILILTLLFIISCDPSDDLVDGYCGNGIKNTNEECDEGISNSNLIPDACREDCKSPTCGDGIKDSEEECDLYQLDSNTCSLMGFDRGTLACNEDCTMDTSLCSICGNGIAELSEDCDQSSLGGATCNAFGFEGGTLGCYEGCIYDFSNCSQGCGNDLVEDGEECDGENQTKPSCEDLGFLGGTIGCSSECSLDYSGCVGGCGNSIVEDLESCDDGNNLPGDGCFNCVSASGNYELIVDMSFPYRPVDLDVRDFDGDGIKDLLVGTLSQNQENGSMSLLLSGDGWSEVHHLVAGPFIKVAGVDITGSGDVAIVGVSLTADGSVIYSYLADYQAEPVSWIMRDRPKSIVAKDIDGIVGEELILSTWPAQSICRFNPETGEMVTLVAMGGEPDDLQIIDFDNDSVNDLVVVRSSSQMISMILGFGDLSFSYYSVRYVGGRISSLAVGDLNGNGYEDLLVTDLANPLLYLIKGGAEGLSNSYTLDLPYKSHKVKISHVNSDGVPDLLLSFPEDNSVSIYSANGDYSYELFHRFGSCSIAMDLEAKDIDSDGLPDVSMICGEEKSVTVYRSIPH